MQHLNAFFFFNDTATTEIYTLSLHDAPPIRVCYLQRAPRRLFEPIPALLEVVIDLRREANADLAGGQPLLETRHRRIARPRRSACGTPDCAAMLNPVQGAFVDVQAARGLEPLARLASGSNIAQRARRP